VEPRAIRRTLLLTVEGERDANAQPGLTRAGGGPAINRSAPLVQWTAFPVATEPPRAVPILLAAVAGFVDACTFLGLFGFFVAQVTGSYVLAGAHPVAGSPGTAALLAVPVFFAGGVAATLAAIAGHAVARRALAAALALEALLLIGFAATFAGGGVEGPETAPVVAASMLGLAAMGVQSALVRLLMRGVASTNVMTTNTSQIAVDATALAWARLWGSNESPEMAHQREVCRRRLRDGLPLPLGFLAGTLVGAFAFASAGSLALVAPVFVVGGLMLWAARCPGIIRTPDRS
jgi:uncharacterized membrane protein YoaK (UPF0700 family)